MFVESRQVTISFTSYSIEYAQIHFVTDMKLISCTQIDIITHCFLNICTRRISLSFVALSCNFIFITVILWTRQTISKLYIFTSYWLRNIKKVMIQEYKRNFYNKIYNFGEEYSIQVMRILPTRNKFYKKILTPVNVVLPYK